MEYDDDFPIVQTNKGPVRGRRCLDYNGTPYYSFVRIPYALCLGGMMRFRCSSWEAKEQWTEPLDCTLDIETQTPPPFTEEHCLYVNVYTPMLPTPATDRSNYRPVLTFIPGENATLSHRNDLEKYGPQYFMMEGIVLMVVSYRSGILGFAKVEDKSLKGEVPGYAGYGDIDNFFTWLSKEHKNFGGSILGGTTVCGQGSGASLMFDSLYQSTKGLFGVTRVILQSINGTTWIGPDDINIKEYAVFSGLASPRHTEGQVLEILRRMPVEELVAFEQRYLNRAKFRALNFWFLKKMSRDCVHTGGLGAAVMIGFNSREGIMDKIHFRKIDRDPENIEKLLKFIWLPHHKRYVRQDTKYRLEHKIRWYFYGEGAASRLKYLQILSDLNHNIQILLTARCLPKKMQSGTKIWLYRFAVDGQLNLVKKTHNARDPGACFGDELGYLFKVPGLPAAEPGSMEDLTIRRMVKLWANFARSGNPNPNPRCPTLGNTGWRVIANDYRRMTRFGCLNIGETLEYGCSQPELYRLSFWYNIWKRIVRKVRRQR